jgi:ketosteroid isomerase-like protein
MSHENVELVRRAHEALNAGDLDRLVSLCHDDFVLDMSDRVFNPETYRGHDGIRQFYADVHDPWERYVWEPDELREKGDVVVALVRARGWGRGSGLEVDRKAAMIWTIQDGKASELRFYRDREAALAAVGLRT